MISIVCPNCGAVHQAPDESLGSGGRRVRCRECREVWLALPPPADGTPALTVSSSAEAEAFTAGDVAQFITDAPVAIGAAAAETETAAASGSEPDQQPVTVAPDFETAAQRRQLKAAAAEQSRPRRRFPFKLAAGGLAAAAVIFAVAGRKAIVEAVPQTASLYAAIRLPVNLRGIDIRSFTGRIMMDGDTRLLVVDGEIANITKQTIAVPPVRFSIRNEAGVEVYSWQAKLDQDTLKPAESLSFRRRLTSPPADGREVFVRFANRGDAGADAGLRSN